MIKMISLIVILTFVGGSLSDNCNRPCRYRNPIKPPETTKELMYLCQKEKACHICLEEVKESSRREEDADEKRENQRTINYMNITCNGDNPTFKAILKNFQCGLPVFRKYCLGEKSRRASDATYMQIKRDFGENEFFSKCLNWHIMNAKCIAITLGYHCGKEMKDAFEEIASYVPLRTGRVEKCPKEFLDRVQPVYEVYEAALLKELIRKDEKLIEEMLPKLTITVNFERKLSQVFVSFPHEMQSSELEGQPKMVH